MTEVAPTETERRLNFRVVENGLSSRKGSWGYRIIRTNEPKKRKDIPLDNFVYDAEPSHKIEVSAHYVDRVYILIKRGEDRPFRVVHPSNPANPSSDDERYADRQLRLKINEELAGALELMEAKRETAGLSNLEITAEPIEVPEE